MKLGLNTYSYRYAAGLWDYTLRENRPMGLDHFLEKAADLNLDGLQLADPRHLDNLEYGYISELKRSADSLRLYLELGTSGTNPDHLQNMVRAAHVLGAPIVRTFVGQARPAWAGRMERLISEAADHIRQVAPVCERYGVSLALENHQDLTTNELLRLIGLVDSGWVGVCFDTANPLALLEDPLESAGALGSLIKTVHLKDYQLVARREGFCLLGCALGEGVVDLPAVLDLIRARSPDASLNIEVYLGKQTLPVLEENYLRQFPELPAIALGRTLRLVRDQGLPREPILPVDCGATEEEILAAEDELVVRSVRWAKQALGRSHPETQNADGQ